MDVEVIHLAWQGPLTIEEVRDLKDDGDYGLYQIYGTHSITGADTLLYVGQANNRKFSVRVPEHEEKWLQWEPEKVRVHVGRVATRKGGPSPSDQEWGDAIDRAEAVTIYFMGPAYNNASIRTLRYDKSGIVLINHLKRGRLPGCISNLSEIAYPNGGGLTEIKTGRTPKPTVSVPKNDPVESH